LLKREKWRIRHLQKKHSNHTRWPKRSCLSSIWPKSLQ
jgi:hypothetical protein